MTYGLFPQHLEKVGAAAASSQSNRQARFAVSSLQSFRIKLGLAEFLLVCGAACVGGAAYHRIVLLDWPDPKQHLAAALLLGITVSGVTLGSRGYDGIEARPRHPFMWAGVSAMTIAFAMFVSVMFLLRFADAYSRGMFLFQLPCMMAAVMTLRGVAYSRLQAAVAGGRIEARRVVLIGGRDVCSEFSRRLSVTGMRTVRALAFPSLEEGSDLAHQANSVVAYARDLIKECRSAEADDIVLLADQEHLSGTRTLSLALSEVPANLHILPVQAIELVEAGRISNFGNMLTIQVARPPLSPTDRLLKRSFDVAVATAGLVLLAPLLLAVAVTIKLDSPGPVLFRQTRHGFNNKPIRVLKFRTMFVLEDGASFKQVVKGDERITRVGRLLRRTNIDELPQLINVLFGDMSIVGPRPHATAHNEMFERLIWPFYRRHNVKPGITGWAQVNGLRGETDTLEKMRRRVEYDLDYIENWSFLLDIRIVIMTLFSAAAYTNAY